MHTLRRHVLQRRPGRFVRSLLLGREAWQQGQLRQRAIRPDAQPFDLPVQIAPEPPFAVALATGQLNAELTDDLAEDVLVALVHAVPQAQWLGGFDGASAGRRGGAPDHAGGAAGEPDFVGRIVARTGGRGQAGRPQTSS